MTPAQQVALDAMRSAWDEATVRRMMWIATEPEATAALMKRLLDAAWMYGAREGMADYASDVIGGTFRVLQNQGRALLGPDPAAPKGTP